MGSLWESKTHLECPASLWFESMIFRSFISSKEVLWVSVGQSAAKLRAIKIGGLKIKYLPLRPLQLKCAQVSVARVRLGLNHSQSFADSNFAALWPKDPIVPIAFDFMKSVTPLLKYIISAQITHTLYSSFWAPIATRGALSNSVFSSPPPGLLSNFQRSL